MKFDNYVCDGQLSIFDIFDCLDNSSNPDLFSWDDDINAIYKKLMEISKDYNIKVDKAEWSIWDHVPSYGFRMWFSYNVTRQDIRNKDFEEAILDVVSFAKEKKIELSPLYNATFFFSNSETASFPLSTTFMDDRRKRKN